MGLDSMAVQNSTRSKAKARNENCLSTGLVGEFHQRQWQEGGNSMPSEVHSFTGEEDCRDIYEVEQPLKNTWSEEQSLQKVRYDEASYQRRMALVREKFIEAKNLAIDGKFLESKEFQDAVEVLNLNRDLFLKFLEEPNSTFTKHGLEPQSLSRPSQTTRITVLKPSNTMDRKAKRLMERRRLSDSDESVGKANRHWSTGFREPRCNALSLPTRIVVLKPSPGEPYHTRTILPNNFPTLMGTHSSIGHLTCDESLISSREAVEQISYQEQGSMGRSRKDEAVSSSVLSNVYIGDERSFNKSGIVYLDDEVERRSHSEMATSATECSWDRSGSPLPVSSFDQTSDSPESLVIIEAKKKLSERLALVASDANFQEPRNVRRSRSMLGEMLAIPESTKEGINEELTHSKFDAEYDPNALSKFLSKFRPEDEFTEENPQKNSSRSKSLRVSSSTHGAYELNAGMSSYSISKSTVQKVAQKPNNARLSLKDKISSFFLSRSKIPRGDKHSIAPSVDDVLSSFNATFTPQILVGSDESYDRSTEILMFPEVAPIENFEEEQDKSNNGSVPQAKLRFDVDNGISPASGGSIVRRPSMSRSPPIESMARSLSHCASCFDLASPKSLNPFMTFTKADEDHDQFVFLQNLLLSSGLDSKKRMVYEGWHSIDTPLNPSLLYRSCHMEDEEEKCRKRCSGRRKLLFDSLNAALLDIGQAALFAAYPWNRKGCHELHEDGDAAVAEQVWKIVRKGLAGDKEPSCSGSVVDRLVNEEVAGKGSDQTRWLEVCEFSKEIGREVMEELVEELVSELLSSR
ncbi:uncharacterized protein LOC141825607 [Curcuma longa]|uniref:uncharacterized protein LOC141825607 n=1 Tax=Curcuma longa TaxID=136217 RepID=UPI003D9EB171